MANAIMFMNFSANEEASLILFDTNPRRMNWQYSTSYFAIGLAAIPAMRLLVSHNYWTCFSATVFNIVAVWLRWASAADRSFSLAILSAVFVGLGGGVTMCTFTAVPHNWFPPEERPLAISLLVQSNYFAWGLGMAVTPYIVTADATSALLTVESQFNRLLLPQAIIISLTVVPFLVFYKAYPDIIAGDRASSIRLSKQDVNCCKPPNPPAKEKMSVKESAAHLLRNRQFVIEGLCYGVLFGLSYTIPAIAPTIIPNLGYSPQVCPFGHVSFIFPDFYVM
jgi:MFS family permease